MKNLTLEQKIEAQKESLNNFLNSLKKNNPELKDAYIFAENTRRLQRFTIIVPSQNGVYFHGSNLNTYDQLNEFMLGYMRKQQNIAILNDNNKVTF